MVPVLAFVFVVAFQSLQASLAVEHDQEEDLTLPKPQQQNKLLVKEDLPKCNFIKNSVELSPDGYTLSGKVATFVCICNAKSQRYRGSLSAIMDEPLSTIPLHMVMAGQLNYGRDVDSHLNFEPGNFGGTPKILIEINRCERIKLKVDFPTLFMTRPGGTGTDVTLQITDSHKVHLTRIQVLPDREHSIVLRNISGKVLISGKIDCLGCSNISKGAATDADSLPTLLKLDASGISDSLTLDGVTSFVPIKLTLRESNALVVKRSSFSVVPWPGFYIYNVTNALIKENWFKDVAPRSLVARAGKQLEITDNILSVANVLDVSSFTHVTIKCNRGQEFEPIPSDCHIPTDLIGLPYRIPSNQLSPELVLFVSLFIIFGHIWIVVVSIAVFIVAVYKFAKGSNEYDDPPSTSIHPPMQNYLSDYPSNYGNYSLAMSPSGEITRQFLNGNVPDSGNREKKFSSCLKSSSVEPSSIVARYNAGQVDSEDDEYSTSSRLHLAGCGGPSQGANEWVAVTPARSPSTSLSASRANPFQVLPVLHQLNSLSLNQHELYCQGFTSQPQQHFISRSEDGSEIYYPGSGGNLSFNHIDSDIEIVPDNSSRGLTTPQDMYGDYTSPPQRRFQWQYTKV